MTAPPPTRWRRSRHSLPAPARSSCPASGSDRARPGSGPRTHAPREPRRRRCRSCCPGRAESGCTECAAGRRATSPFAPSAGTPRWRASPRRASGPIRCGRRRPASARTRNSRASRARAARKPRFFESIRAACLVSPGPVPGCPVPERADVTACGRSRSQDQARQEESARGALPRHLVQCHGSRGPGVEARRVGRGQYPTWAQNSAVVVLATIPSARRRYKTDTRSTLFGSFPGRSRISFAAA